jgi:uncharacterized membrane protein YdjX (TVP38/TMEM64 family)
MMQRIIILAVVVLAVGAFFALGLGHCLSLEYLQASRERAIEQAHQAPIVASVVFFAVYVLVTGLSLPGAAVMTLAAGAIFGLVWGVLLVSFASSVGATLAFLIARSLLGEWVTRRFGQYLEPINRGFDTEGSFYLFSLRMVPVFPFFVVNLLMGLTRIGVAQFYVVSQIGMLAGTVVFVFAGTQLAEIHKLADVLSPGLMIALTLLGVFPLVAKRLLRLIAQRRARAAG